MEGLIDYAGLFPPASLDMAAAVRNYAAYRKSGEKAWLGRFVLPVSRLGEFAAARSPGGTAEETWRLSALAGNDLAADLAAIAAFNRSPYASTAVVDGIELKASTPEAVAGAREIIPQGLTAYIEIPLADPAPLLAAVSKAGARAKVRTGGVTPDMIPAPEDLARFIAACARARVPFKATAGLHHPVRALRPLTYAPDSPKGVMHGFLNVFLAAAFAAQGRDEAFLAAVIREESPQAFRFAAGEAAWDGERVAAAALGRARSDFALAFGSCSFEEPVADLKEAGLA